MIPTNFKPGDVICVGTGGFAGRLIRWRSWLMRKPDLANHIAMFTHYDDAGQPRGVEGRPSSFGWVNLTKYLEMPYVTNAGKTNYPDEERAKAVERARQMVAMPYDWAQIIAFTLRLVGLRFDPKEWPETGLPSSNTCASALDLIHEELRWPNPGSWGQTRGTDVDDWVELIEEEWP